MSNQLIKSSNIKDVVQSEAVKARLKEIMGDRGAAFGAALVQIVKQSFQLQKCDANSVIGAALTAAALDLSVDPNIGEAHIIPYGDQAQFQIGYKGFIQLAMRSGEYRAFGSTVVFDGELINYDELTGELVIDKSKRKEDAKVIGYAAKFKLLNGFERGEFWTVQEIENHAMLYSKQYRYAKGKPDKEANCLWITKRDEMAIKTVEKSLLNHYGPKSIQMKKAIKMDGGAVIDADAEEVAYIDNEKDSKVTEPQFTEVEVESEAPAPAPAKTAPAPKATSRPQSSPSNPEPQDKAENPAKKMREDIAAAGLTVEKVLGFLSCDGGPIGKEIETIEQLYLEEKSAFHMLEKQKNDIFNRVRGVA